MSIIKPSHFIKLKELVKNGKIATDDWVATEYDALHDLGFEIDNLYNMEFEHTEEVKGKEKFLAIRIHRTDDDWVMEVKTNRSNDFVTRKYKEFKTLMKVIHEIFKKF